MMGIRWQSLKVLGWRNIIIYEQVKIVHRRLPVLRTTIGGVHHMLIYFRGGAALLSFTNHGPRRDVDMGNDWDMVLAMRAFTDKFL